MTSLGIGKEEEEFLARVGKGKYVDKALAAKRKRERQAKLRKGMAGFKIPDKDIRKAVPFEKRMASVTKQLETGLYDRPENDASIPNINTTVAPMVGRGFGLQSPAPSPPGTPTGRVSAPPFAHPTPLALTNALP